MYNFIIKMKKVFLLSISKWVIIVVASLLIMFTIISYVDYGVAQEVDKRNKIHLTSGRFKKLWAPKNVDFADFMQAAGPGILKSEVIQKSEDLQDIYILFVLRDDDLHQFMEEKILAKDLSENLSDEHAEKELELKDADYIILATFCMQSKEEVRIDARIGRMSTGTLEHAADVLFQPENVNAALSDLASSILNSVNPVKSDKESPQTSSAITIAPYNFVNTAENDEYSWLETSLPQGIFDALAMLGPNNVITKLHRDLKRGDSAKSYNYKEMTEHFKVNSILTGDFLINGGQIRSRARIVKSDNVPIVTVETTVALGDILSLDMTICMIFQVELILK